MLTSRNAGRCGPLRGRAAGPLVALALAAACALPAAAQPGPGGVVRPGGVRPDVRPPQQVRPLDPLTPRERELAVRLATGDERVRRLADGRDFDVAYVELAVAKSADARSDTPERPAVAGRTAEVLISAYGRSPFVGIRAIVDLERQAVTEVSGYSVEAVAEEGRGPAFRVPFSPAERRLAREVATRNADVRAMMGPRTDGWVVEGLPVTRRVPDLCPSGRCLRMVFRRGDTYLTSTVIVDIPSRTARLMRGPR